MHVLQVAWEFPPRLFGGLGRHVEGLVGALVAGGERVSVLTPHSPEERSPDPSPGLRVLRAAPPLAALPAAQWVAEVLEANLAMVDRGLGALVPGHPGSGPSSAPAEPAIGVVHVHDWMAGRAGRLLAGRLGVPLVATIHATERGRHMGHLPAGVSGWIDAEERDLVAEAARVVVCAEGMRQQAREWLGARRVTVIGNGVEVARWDLGLRRRPRRVAMAGRLEFEKGAQVLLAATEDLDAEVVIAGRGSQGSTLRDSAHPRVRFTGHLPQPRLAELLASAEVVVIPSLYEPFGLAALEAMAAGTPVVASAVGGLPDVVGDAGVLVPPDDPQALRRALEELLEDPGQRERLGAAGRSRAAAMSWDRTAARHRALYEQLLGSR